MKKTLISGIVLLAILLGSTDSQAQQQITSRASKGNSKKQPKPQADWIEGKFESKKGVMHPASCHCYNVGILSTGNDDEVIICFDELPNSSDLDIDCKKIKVQGDLRSHTTKSDGNSPCPSSTKDIFYVKKWECKN